MFDPYHKWLGIPPDEQPPNHYRLLGINPFDAGAIKVLEVFEDIEALSRAAARKIVARGSEAVAARGRFDWLLAGGSTPRRTYEVLAAEHRDRQDLWRKTHFYWGDERCVPPEDPQSNYALAERSLLAPLAIPAENIHRVRGEGPDREAAAAQYDALLPDRADLVLLGLGEDGHTASLFPDSPALEEGCRRVVAVEGAKAPKHRITVTPPVLRTARQVMVLVSGRAKAEALRLALAVEGEVRRTPARLVRHGMWLADREAASAP